jgi:hypothetical protein
MQSLNHVNDLTSLMEHHLSEMRDEAKNELETKKGRDTASELIDEMDEALETIQTILTQIDVLN